jgi:hypothetical protein
MWAMSQDQKTNGVAEKPFYRFHQITILIGNFDSATHSLSQAKIAVGR